MVCIIVTEGCIYTELTFTSKRKFSRNIISLRKMLPTAIYVLFLISDLFAVLT